MLSLLVSFQSFGSSAVIAAFLLYLMGLATKRLLLVVCLAWSSLLYSILFPLLVYGLRATATQLATYKEELLQADRQPDERWMYLDICYVTHAICPAIYHEFTALMEASQQRRKEVIKLLLAHGANTNAKDKVSYLVYSQPVIYLI